MRVCAEALLIHGSFLCFFLWNYPTELEDILRHLCALIWHVESTKSHLIRYLLAMRVPASDCR